MYIYIVIAVLFSIGAIYNLFQESKDWANIGAGFGIAALSLVMYFWVAWNYRKRHETLRWLRDHKDEITDEPRVFPNSPFPNKPICKSTKVRNFKVVSSALFVTTIHDIGGDIRHSAIRGIIATVWTLLFGWWGLPWGPIRTIQGLITNLIGGEKQTVHEAMLFAEAALELEGANSKL